jgi:hypothetical protein
LAPAPSSSPFFAFLLPISVNPEDSRASFNNPEPSLMNWSIAACISLTEGRLWSTTALMALLDKPVIFEISSASKLIAPRRAPRPRDYKILPLSSHFQELEGE